MSRTSGILPSSTLILWMKVESLNKEMIEQKEFAELEKVPFFCMIQDFIT